MFSTNKPFLSYATGGTFSLNGCSVGLSEVFAGRRAEGRSWNGTFINLNSGSFMFINTDFRDILVNGENAFIAATVEEGKAFIIKGCTFIRCGFQQSRVVL
jgi:hypothetical protein